MKLIRELRMGCAKQYKTGAICNTYPRPLLVLNFDESGLDVLRESPTIIPTTEIEGHCKLTCDKLSPLSVIDFCDTQTKLMTEAWKPTANSKPFKEFVKVVNSLVKTGCPWKTVVLDSVSGLGDTIIAHMAETSGTSLDSALKWAPMAGSKIYQCLGVMTGLPCHVVFICHASSPSKDETTSVVERAPLVPSQWLRDRIGTLVSQYFYQEIIAGKPTVITTNDASVYVKGVGCRWPDNLPTKVGADYKSIYETTYPKKV